LAVVLRAFVCAWAHVCVCVCVCVLCMRVDCVACVCTRVRVHAREHANALPPADDDPHSKGLIFAEGLD
jgi:hypothetical protein